MSTHCTIGYETEDGGYVGVYCNFDGYPDHVMPILNVSSHEEVKRNVERALVQGGLRDVECWETYGDYRGEKSNRDEWLSEGWPCRDNTYNYRVRIDGSVECISA